MDQIRLKRLGAIAPITDVVLNWKDLDEAIEYFKGQALDDISVLHHNEIESCVALMNKLGISRTELASKVNRSLYYRTY